MTGVLERPGSSQVFTAAQDFSHLRYLGSLGHVTGLNYSYACPGGCDQLACTLQISSLSFPDAIDVGRWVYVVRGSSIIWTGKTDEPQPSSAGWQVTAHGSGTYGADFAAIYSGNWGSGTPDIAVNQAITRGLAWINPGIGTPSGMWTGQPVDDGAQQVTDLLNLICTKGGLTWYVSTRPTGNILRVFPLPTTVTNLLVSNTPVPRTLGGDVNAIWLRYQSKSDAAASPATFGTVVATDPNSIARHGTMETFADLSSAQVLSATAAKAVGTAVLNRYQRASFAGPFAVGPGQLLTTGGAPVDLGAGMPYAPMVCRLMLTDQSYGGEITPAPIEFLAGAYAFDDDSQTATITPFQSLRTDFASLLSMVVSTEPARQIAKTSTKSATHTHRGG